MNPNKKRNRLTVCALAIYAVAPPLIGGQFTGADAIKMYWEFFPAIPFIGICFTLFGMRHLSGKEIAALLKEEPLTREPMAIQIKQGKPLRVHHLSKIMADVEVEKFMRKKHCSRRNFLKEQKAAIDIDRPKERRWEDL